MNTNQTDIDESEIDIKELFNSLYRQKFIILFFIIVSTAIGGYIAYFKPNVYVASTTVEVGVERYGRSHDTGDVLNRAMDPGASSSETEMGIIRSRFIADKAAKDVDVLHRYYTTNKFKEYELYKNSPFEVGMIKGYGISFEVYPLNKDMYRLKVEEQVDKYGHKWSHSKVHPYGQEVHTKHFHLNVVKRKDFRYDKYRFVVFNPKDRGSIAQRGVSVRQLTKYSALLVISYTDNVALRAKEFTNALAKAYIEQNIEKKNKEATRKLKFVDKQLKRITENLSGSALKIEEFKKSSNTIDLHIKAESVITTLEEKEKELSTIVIEEEMLNRIFEQVQDDETISSIAFDFKDDTGNSLLQIVNKLQNLLIEKQTLRQDYTEMYPEVIKINKNIKHMKNTIINIIKNMKKNIKERKILFEKSIASKQKVLDRLPADERIFGHLNRKFTINEKIYSYLLEKHSETAIIRASTVSKNRILDKALLPSPSVKPKRYIIVLVGLFIGLFLGIAFVLIKNLLNDKIKSEDDITKSNLPMLGSIPKINSEHNQIKVFSSPKSSVAESFRNLRTNLQFMLGSKDVHIISVTSTVGGEGKTTVCTNLGAIMSMAGKKTIILSLDMRKPTLHTKFKLLNRNGMSTVLSENARLSEVIQKTKYENIDIVASGPIPPNPSELIQSKVMENIIEKLKRTYEVIIFDTPPVGLVTDARILMQHSNTTIYVLRAGYSKKSFLNNIKELSKIDNIKGLSVLLNEVKLEDQKYSYGYSTSYGNGYYEEDNS